MQTVFSFSASTIQGDNVDFGIFRDKVLLIVNTASHCGFTPQYQGLEQLQNFFKDDGFSVLAFPCNQFGQQEPGDAQTINHFCQNQYNVSFPIFEKIDVNGTNTHLLYQFLKSSAPGIMGSKSIKWNFSKFLIRRDGSVYKRYSPLITPAMLHKDINHLLNRST